MQRSNKALLKIAVDRGYLTLDDARTVLRAAKTRGCSVERVLREDKLLSERRIARLSTHFRYRSMRKVDKVYAMLAVRKGILTKGQVLTSLKAQKRGFESKRECTRLGNLLIERKLITVAQDRMLRGEATGSKIPSDVVRAVEDDIPSSAATLALHEGSKMGIEIGTRNSYRMITDAVDRIDAIREIQADLSTSDNVGCGPPVRGDSANEIESALSMLARRRLGATPTPSSSSGRAVKPRSRKRAKKTTGLMKIFRLTA